MVMGVSALMALMAVCLRFDGSCSPHHRRVAKMVYSSSLMEASFFTIAQRSDIDRAVEAKKRIQEISDLNQVWESVMFPKE